MSEPIDPGVDIGHVHLKVADIDRALDFYSGVLGFEGRRGWAPTRPSSPLATITTTSASTPGSQGRLAARAGHDRPLSHAIRYPTRRALADAVKRVIDAGVPLTGAADHGVSEAIYLNDPDQNGVELYWDRPRDEWPRPQTARPESRCPRRLSTSPTCSPSSKRGLDVHDRRAVQGLQRPDVNARYVDREDLHLVQAIGLGRYSERVLNTPSIGLAGSSARVRAAGRRDRRGRARSAARLDRRAQGRRGRAAPRTRTRARQVAAPLRNPAWAPPLDRPASNTTVPIRLSSQSCGSILAVARL